MKNWITYQPLWWACGALSELLDYMTGPNIQFPILFVLPVAGMARFCGVAPAIVLSVALTGLRGVTLQMWGSDPFGFYPLINSVIRVAVLIIVAFAVRQFVELKILRGLLPICANCKKIRTKDGDWQQIEKYITNHSDALFSHGICAECSETLYGAQLREMTKRR